MSGIEASGETNGMNMENTAAMPAGDGGEHGTDGTNVNDMTNGAGHGVSPDDGMSVPITELRSDLDLDDPRCGLKIAAERLSIVRYVFLVQIEDGIASASQRASLEYADAVLIGWPDEDAPDVVDLDAAQLKSVRSHMEMMEEYIRRFSTLEREGDVDGMTDTLIRVTERVAEVRRLYQPDFPLPTFAEIRRVVQDEWNEDMGKIDPKGDDPTAVEIEQETEREDVRNGAAAASAGAAPSDAHDPAAHDAARADGGTGNRS